MTPEELAALARRAAAARDPAAPSGGVDLAALAQRARAARDTPNRVQAAVRGLGQGLTFGWQDEITAGMRAAVSMMPGGQSPGEAYANELERQQGRDAQAREAYPVTMGGAELAGGVASGVTGGLAAGMGRAGTGLAARLGIGAGAGGIEGGIYGAGSADVGERLEGAGKGMAVGAGVGAVAVPLAGATSRVVGAVKEPVMGAMGIGNQRRAARSVARRLERAGETPQSIDAALRAARDDGQGEFMVADALGYEGQRALSGLARTPGVLRQRLVERLDDRQAGQNARVSGFVADNLGVSGTAAERQAAMQAQRGQVASRLYDEARQNAAPVDVSGALGAIDARIGPMEGSGVTGDGIDARLRRYRDRLAAPANKLPNGASAVELSDFDRVLGVKQAIQDDIGAAVRAGRNNEARELGKIAAKLDGALEESSAGYRAANDRYRTDSAALEQIDRGRAAASPSRRPEDVAREFAAVPSAPNTAPAIPGQVSMDPRAAYRQGYADPVQARLERQVEGGDAARQFRARQSREIMDAIGIDPAQFSRRIGRETTMHETRRQATGGSMTAQNLADNEEAGDMALGAMAEGVRDVGNLRFGDLAVRAARAMGGQNEATQRAIADMLMSGDASALLPAQQVAGSDALRRLFLESLMRQSGGRPAISLAR